MVQLVECSPSIGEVLSSILSTARINWDWRYVSCNSSTMEEAERSGVQGQPQLHHEFETSLGYILNSISRTKQINNNSKEKRYLLILETSKATVSHCLGGVMW